MGKYMWGFSQKLIEVIEFRTGRVLICMCYEVAVCMCMARRIPTSVDVLKPYPSSLGSANALHNFRNIKYFERAFWATYSIV